MPAQKVIFTKHGTQRYFPHINHLTTDYHQDHIYLTCHVKLPQIQQESMNHKQQHAMKI